MMLNESTMEAPKPTLESVLNTMVIRGGVLSMRTTPAGFNRRMRKTARPVVWKAHGAKSP